MDKWPETQGVQLKTLVSKMGFLVKYHTCKVTLFTSKGECNFQIFVDCREYCI